ncbi:MAG: sugar phosphate isomerase/epimerase family protein [Planctomycetota bacterium]
MDRRAFLIAAGGVALFARRAPGRERARSRLGIAVYALGNRIRARPAEGLDDPLEFLQRCRDLGAGGVQIALGVRDDASAARLRERAEADGMFVEGIVKLPAGRSELERFEAEMRTAARAGARVARTVLTPGRRYEKYRDAEEFRAALRRGRESLEAAEPLAAKHGVRIAVENHNDQRVEERLEILRALSSEHVGACVDPANAFSLLEDPVRVAEAYAPFALSVHLKDLAVREHPDGFLEADVALGDGIVDLPKVVRVLREAKPEVRFQLETIAKEPHLVPCLTDAYWDLLGSAPARDLAATLRAVRARAAAQLPPFEELSVEERIEREEAMVRRSLAYAGERLGL